MQEHLNLIHLNINILKNVCDATRNNTLVSVYDTGGAANRNV